MIKVKVKTINESEDIASIMMKYECKKTSTIEHFALVYKAITEILKKSEMTKEDVKNQISKYVDNIEITDKM